MPKPSSQTEVAIQESFFETSDGARLWFEVRGSGLANSKTPVLLCDGLGCDGFIWRYLWDPLTQNRRVLHSHYRGHGKSGTAGDERRIGVEFICDDLDALCEKNGFKHVVVLGHSMGVQVALEFHRRFPERVKGLGLICGSFGTPLDTWHDHTMLRVVFPYLLKTVEAAPELARKTLSAICKTQLAVEFGIRTELNPALMKRNDFAPYMQHLASMHPKYFVRTLNSLKDHSAWEHLPDVKVPTLVLGGEGDRFTPVWLSQRMAEHIPECDYVFVPGGTHTAPLERPTLVNTEIEKLLAKVDALSLMVSSGIFEPTKTARRGRRAPRPTR
jgi:pimeloyl-ACP methyl ester carboxylesterase